MKTFCRFALRHDSPYLSNVARNTRRFAPYRKPLSLSAEWRPIYLAFDGHLSRGVGGMGGHAVYYVLLVEIPTEVAQIRQESRLHVGRQKA